MVRGPIFALLLGGGMCAGFLLWTGDSPERTVAPPVSLDQPSFRMVGHDWAEFLDPPRPRESRFVRESRMFDRLAGSGALQPCRESNCRACRWQAHFGGEW